jgi:hypothetical protein
MISLKNYEEYITKIGDRYNLFKLLKDKFDIKTIVYPGSYIDITPSFFFPSAYYIDTDKKAKKFFENENSILNYLKKNKIYKEDIKIKYYPKDYRLNFQDTITSSDLLISLYAGFISKYCKNLLKKNGLLLANNSHGDASMAKLDNDFEFYGVINYRNKKYYLSNDELDEYFIPKKDIIVTKELLEKTNRGIGYKKPANYYLFIKK